MSRTNITITILAIFTIFLMFLELANVLIKGGNVPEFSNHYPIVGVILLGTSMLFYSQFRYDEMIDEGVQRLREKQGKVK